MKATASRIEYEVRPYRSVDEPRVLELLTTVLGAGPAGGRSPEFFRWKHGLNPFGSSFMLVAESDERIIGLRAFMRWRFRAGGRVLRAVQAVDTATHPDFQGIGIFSRLTREAIDVLRDEIDLVFNTPNDKSLPGYLKMGWRVAGRVRILVRIRKPVRFASGMRSLRRAVETAGPSPRVDAETVAEALGDDRSVRDLLDESDPSDDRIQTERDVDYFRWRYAATPRMNYWAVREEASGSLRGLAFFRVRPRGKLWEAAITDLVVAPGDESTARRLLRRVAGTVSVDHLSCHFPSGSSPAAAARRSGYVRSPAGVTLAVNVLGHELQPDPTDLRSWGLSLGDLEVF